VSLTLHALIARKGKLPVHSLYHLMSS